ncbi:MAG: hypothetical protein BWY53_00349 [Parcubacteria group bacterium ADurb.Bin326]|nr:MAG: hypothetical protein BWY53_00349 [Parcubacteria group bacterium ADurb.Bin326]
MKINYEKTIIPILLGILPIVGAMVGSYFTYKYSQNLFIVQRQIELREKSYSEIMGVKRPIIQTTQTIAEAKILTEYYNFRFKYISGDQFDRDFAIKENQRMLELIPQFSSLSRELFESLGSVRISYKINKNLETKIQELYDFKVFNVEAPDNKLVKTDEDLNKWKEQKAKELDVFLQENIKKKTDDLLLLLFEQIRIKG